MAIGSRILLIDDEPFFRLVMRSFLKKIGYAIDEADNVDDGLAKVRTFDPEIVLLDVVMPGQSGVEVLDTIKKWKPDCEVIMVTGVLSEETKNDCLAKGAFAVMAKPVELEDLRATVMSAFEKKETAS